MRVDSLRRFAKALKIDGYSTKSVHDLIHMIDQLPRTKIHLSLDDIAILNDMHTGLHRIMFVDGNGPAFELAEFGLSSGYVSYCTDDKIETIDNDEYTEQVRIRSIDELIRIIESIEVIDKSLYVIK